MSDVRPKQEREKTIERGQLFMILPEDLIPTADLTLPRYQIDEKMIEGIDEWGVVLSLTVFVDGTQTKINTGHRRWVHALEVNKRRRERDKENAILLRVPCRFQKGDDVRLKSIRLLENCQRMDDDPLTIAQELQWFVDQGQPLQIAAKAVGKDEDTVRDYIKLLVLDHQVQKAVQKGEVPYTRAIKLHGLSREEQRASLKEYKEQGGGSKKEKSKKKAARDKGKPTLRGTQAPSKYALREVAASAEAASDSLIYRVFVVALKFAAGDLNKEETEKAVGNLEKEYAAIQEKLSKVSDQEVPPPPEDSESEKETVFKS